MRQLERMWSGEMLPLRADQILTRKTANVMLTIPQGILYYLAANPTKCDCVIAEFAGVSAAALTGIPSSLITNLKTLSSYMTVIPIISCRHGLSLYLSKQLEVARVKSLHLPGTPGPARL